MCIYSCSVGPETPTIDNAMAVIYSDGTVTWIPPMTVKATCQSDGNFPFDTQVNLMSTLCCGQCISFTLSHILLISTKVRLFGQFYHFDTFSQ